MSKTTTGCTRPRATHMATLAVALILASAAAARDTLGVFEQWGAFRDPASSAAPLRCYAIAEPDSGAAAVRYLTIGYWPASRVRGQLHIRLASPARAGSTATLALGGRRFQLAVRGTSAWAADARMDAAIVAAMRSAATMRVGIGAATATWRLRGAATAMDAAALGCARQ